MAPDLKRAKNDRVSKWNAEVPTDASFGVGPEGPTVIGEWARFREPPRVAGVPVVAVDPRDMSRTRPVCGRIERQSSCYFLGERDTAVTRYNQVIRRQWPVISKARR